MTRHVASGLISPVIAGHCYCDQCVWSCDLTGSVVRLHQYTSAAGTELSVMVRQPGAPTTLRDVMNSGIHADQLRHLIPPVTNFSDPSSALLAFFAFSQRTSYCLVLSRRLHQL